MRSCNGLHIDATTREHGCTTPTQAQSMKAQLCDALSAAVRRATKPAPRAARTQPSCNNGRGQLQAHKRAKETTCSRLFCRMRSYKSGLTTCDAGGGHALRVCWGECFTMASKASIPSRVQSSVWSLNEQSAVIQIKISLDGVWDLTAVWTSGCSCSASHV